MKEAATMDQPMGSEAKETAMAFAQCISEIDRHLDEMRQEQNTIQKIGARTDATLAEIVEILTELKAA